MIETKGLTGAQALLRVLGGMGVERIFASPGSEWSPVWEALAEPGAERIPLYLSTRHEEVAVGMASGYAKSTGKLPAVMIHTTVGALHATMAMRGALHEQVPMVVFTGESVGFGEEEGPDVGGQWLGHLADVGGPARLVEPTVKWSFGVNARSILPATIERACRIAMAAPRGPVFVSIPMEYLFAPMTRDVASDRIEAPAPVADPKGIEELAEMLARAENPIIIAEDAGRTPHAVESLVEIAELLGAGVVETRSTGCINFPRAHALHAGYTPAEYLREGDAFLALATIAPWHPASRRPERPGARVAWLDENPLRTELPYHGFAADLCLTGEIERSLEELLRALRKRVSPGEPERARRAEAWKERNEARRRRWREEAAALCAAKPMDTRWVAHEISRALPPDAMVVEETITHRLAVHRYLDGLAPGSFFAGCIGGLGTGLPTALGVKSANPKRTVVCLIGDGAFNYDPVPGALGAAQEHQLPILIIMFNNQGYLSQKTGVPKYYPQGWAVRANRFAGLDIAPCPDYALLARVFGGYGETIEEPAEVRKAVERGLRAVAAGQLAILDMRLKPVAETLERGEG
ncbi:MAG TPA: thiamine pyrophosphate-binding protein [candidate division Zixibacteria bacterium]|nr:thiamine pyrophosphate-binding protein [candidate division Zixibacteria bacterium]